MSHSKNNMEDSASTKRIIELVMDVHTFMRPPGRDPTRIDGVVEKLREVWKRHPDLRLAQLVFNVSGATQPCPEIFYLEDDVLLRSLDCFESQE